MVSVRPRALLVCFVLILTVDQVSRSSMLIETSVPPARTESDFLQSEIVENVTMPVASTMMTADENPLTGSDEINYLPQQLYRVYRVTAYCDRGTTAAGVPSGVGQCAAPADIPFGSRIYIPELDRTFIVTDRTALRFRHNTVDLFMPDRATCKHFGRRYLECEITVPSEKIGYASREIHQILADARESEGAESFASVAGSQSQPRAERIPIHFATSESGRTVVAGEFIAREQRDALVVRDTDARKQGANRASILRPRLSIPQTYTVIYLSQDAD